MQGGDVESLSALMPTLMDEWPKISTETVHAAYHRGPEHLKLVIANRGGYCANA